MTASVSFRHLSEWPHRMLDSAGILQPVDGGSRDAELACYMVRPEAMRTFGLRHSTLMHIASAGLIRWVKGPAQNFPDGYYFFLRQDVLKIKHAFEKHAVAVKEYATPTEIALRHAMKNYPGRGSGLAAVIRGFAAEEHGPPGTH